MAEFVTDTFTAATDEDLDTVHVGETGATWAKNNWNTSVTNAKVDSASDTLIQAVNNFEHYYASGVPAGAEYDVEADFVVQSTDNFRQAAIQGRMSTSAGTFYQAELDPNDDKLYLRKYSAGTPTELGQYTYSGGVATYTVKLEIRDAAKKAYIGGVERISSGDNAITAAGKAGLLIRNVTSSSGPKLDNFKATDAGGDTTAPILTSPTGTKTGSTTASGTVTTDEGNGTLYFIATINASESAATIKAGSSQAVTGTGVQNVSFTGLSPSTTYYAHYVHVDAATNESNVVSSASFTTDAAAGVTIPIFMNHYRNQGIS